MTVGRSTLPENFFDITSPYLLRQPEAQYLYARLWKSAMQADLPKGDALGLPGREVGGVGADYQSVDVGRLLLAQDLMSEMFAARFNMTGMPGHTVRVNRPKFADTTYTVAARQIVQNQTISTVPVDIGSEQVTLTLKQFAGPYDQSNSRVAPFGLDAFDASVGVHKAAQMVGLHMQRDLDKFLDAVVVALLDNAATVVRPAGMTADNDATATGQFKMDYDTLNRTELALDEANIPYFADGFRALVLTPRQAQQLKDDTQFARYAQFFREANPLFPGYLGTVNKFHVFKSNTNTVSANSSSINIHRGCAFGPGVLATALGQPPKIRSSTDDNYGLTAKAIWHMHADFVLADNRFCVSVRTSA